MSKFQGYFEFPKLKDSKTLYFCGNSLGLKPKKTDIYLKKELCEEIAARGVYVVPLSKGVRIGVCSLPTDKAARAGEAIAEAWRSLGR